MPKWKAKRQWSVDKREGAIHGYVEPQAERMQQEGAASSSSRESKPPPPSHPPTDDVLDEERPSALDLMSGVNHPLGRALTWCGWHCESFDTLIDPKHDMRLKEVQHHLLEKIPTTDLTFIGLDCKTLSKIREKFIPNHPNPPKPLRSDQHVKGLPGLGEGGQKRVDDANTLVAFTCLLIKRVVQCGNAFGLENPRNSYLWMLMTLMEDVLDADQWTDTFYAACASAGARCKKQTIRHNVPEFDQIKSECHHTHDPQEWAPQHIT